MYKDGLRTSATRVLVATMMLALGAAAILQTLLS